MSESLVVDHQPSRKFLECQDEAPATAVARFTSSAPEHPRIKVTYRQGRSSPYRSSGTISRRDTRLKIYAIGIAFALDGVRNQYRICSSRTSIDVQLCER